MVSNPMQRKSRNSFLLGMFLAILIMGVIVGFLLWQMKNIKDEEDAIKSAQKQVYVLTSDVKSGDSLTAASLKMVTAMSDSVPSDAITPASLTESSISRLDLKKGTIITSNLIQDSTNKTTDDVRVQEYNMLKISSQIQTGDYVDIRLRMPSGLDYVVVSKKQVEIPQISGVDSENTIWLKLTEDETLTMSNAIVESYIMDGSVLYTTTYTEPGTQVASTVTYIPSTSVVNLITTDANVVNEAKTAIYNRYNSDSIGTRNKINGEISGYSDKASDSINSKTSTEVTTTQTQRKSYLDALSGQ